MKRLPFARRIVAALGAIAFAASPGFAAPEYGGHLRVAYTLFPTSLDPVLGRSGGDAYYWRQIFDPLVDADGELVPRASSSLAESWEISTDPDVITLKLREGVTFHDGTKLDAEAVKKNIERVLDPATQATPRASMTVIESVDVVDPLTVRLNLSGPWGAGLAMLADRGGQMNSPTAVAEKGEDYGWNPVGTGPFRVKEVVTGSHVHLVRNENYWGVDEEGNRLPYLDEITITLIKDPSVLVSALRAGEIDVAYVPYKDVQAFKDDDRFKMEIVEGGSLAYLMAFNTAKPPMDDMNLRLAVAHAVNPEDINNAVYFGNAIVADAGMWPVNSWVHDPDTSRPTYDLEKARAYLEKAGKPDGFEFDAVTWQSSEHVPSAEIAAAQLSQLGIKMNIEVLSVGPATTGFFQDQAYPLYLTSWSRYPEPDWIASLNYKSDGYYNAGKVSRPEMDEMIQEAASLYDIEERKKIYNQINEVVLNEAWYVPLLYGVTYAAAANEVQNLDTLVGWDGKMNLKELWLDR